MRPEKQAIFEEINSQISGSSFVIVAEYRGLKVEQFSDLRRQLHKVGAKIQVVKNRFLRVMTRDKGWSGLESSLKGQSAIVTGVDVVKAAKTIKLFNKANGLPLVKSGVMGNMILTSAQIGALAELPPREVLLGQVVGTVAAPLSRLVGVMKQKVTTIVQVIKAVEDKKNAA
ncbi:MAG: 50S ribosomal protein L10 [bacterium]